MSNRQSPSFKTPKGIAVYPRLARPDTKFHDLGIYKADLLVDMTEAKPLLVKLGDMFKAHTGKAVNKFDNSMFTVEMDDDGEQTGKVLFKLRVKNRIGRDGEVWDRKPQMFDAMTTPCPTAKPFGGSQMIVNFEAFAWENGGKKGISLQPIAIQILKLVEGEQQSSSSFGFEANEGGFTAASMPSMPDVEEQDDDSAEADW